MPRKRRTHKAQERATLTKNPLAQAFGLALQSARKQELKSSQQMARELGVSSSLYRLIESASTTLQPNKALSLIKALPDTPIEFRPLSLLLVAIQITESQMGNPDGVKLLAKEVGELDPGLGSLIDLLDAVWREAGDDTDSQKIARLIERRGIPQRLLEFLARAREAETREETPTARHWGAQLLTGLRPVYFDALETLVSVLKKFPPKVGVDEVGAWEKGHYGRFRTLDGVLTSFEILNETYDEFDWRFVTDENFTRLRIISLASAENEKSERDAYQKFMRRLQKELSAKRDIDRRVKPLAALQEYGFAHRCGDIRRRFVDLFNLEMATENSTSSPDKLAGKTTPAFRNAWIYEIVPAGRPHADETYNVVFMDDRARKEDKYEVVNCRWEVTERWLGLLHEFWNFKGEGA